MPDINIILTVKYIMAGAIVWCAYMFPAWLARQNGIDGLNMAQVRIYSWLFGWTIVGWLVGLWWACKK
ncbi:MAG: hypothetical protein FWG39_03440 [Alphaproteobacteria bacterium]|nr:hypothetical protein [Alphaproteobacteria bacterium]